MSQQTNRFLLDNAIRLGWDGEEGLPHGLNTRPHPSQVNKSNPKNVERIWKLLDDKNDKVDPVVTIFWAYLDVHLIQWVYN